MRGAIPPSQTSLWRYASKHILDFTLQPNITKHMRLELGNHFKLLIVTKISTTGRVSQVTVYQKNIRLQWQEL